MIYIPKFCTSLPKMVNFIQESLTFPVDTGQKLNVRKTFRRRLGRLLKVLCMFSLRPVSTGYATSTMNSICTLLQIVLLKFYLIA